MGQRLVINAMIGEKRIGAVYYHWSAYTKAAMQEAVELFTNFHAVMAGDEVAIKDKTKEQLMKKYGYLNKEDKDTLPLAYFQLALIRACERAGGGIDGGKDGREMQYVHSIFPDEPFSTKPDRILGLVCISDAGVEELHSWEEGGLTLDLLSGEITNFTVLWSNDNLEEAMEDNDLTMEEIQKNYFDFPETFNVSDVNALISALNKMGSYYWIDGNNVFNVLIE
jgi:hypothetical protein